VNWVFPRAVSYGPLPATRVVYPREYSRMSQRSGKHVPKHRKSRSSVVANRAPRRVLRNTVMLSSVAAAATAGVVTTGIASTSPVVLGTASKRLTETEPTDERTEALRPSTPLSRSAGRKDADRTKDRPQERERSSDESQTEDDFSDADPRDIGMALLPEYGFSADQFSCLDALYVSESDWRVDADNPTSSAYGIPQALTSMHDLPAGYYTDAEVQIRWGLEYIKDSYGSPCSAWEFKQSNNWY
jgi:hypothetical protein